jgi:hypothetical protein
MKNKTKKIILSVLLLLSLGNYVRSSDSSPIRTIDFLSIFAIGAITALLINTIFKKDSN